MALLTVENLHTTFRTDDGAVGAVDGVSLSVDAGQVLGIVGESGCGKSAMSLSIMGLLPDSAVVEGSIRLGEHELVGMSKRELRTLRGSEMAMIFQDPMTSLNPVMRIGWQLEEAVLLHQKVSRKQARALAIEGLTAVGIPSPAERMRSYPFELSGGMRQRVMIAMALLNRPRLLIADEPTTALDVTTQAQILELMRELRREVDAAIILITHDLGVVAEVCDEVAVMYAGAHRRARARRRVVRSTAASVHLGPTGLATRAWSSRRAAPPDPRLAAESIAPPGRLPLRATLSDGSACLSPRSRASVARYGDRGCAGRLLPRCGDARSRGRSLYEHGGAGMSDPILKATGIKIGFPVKRGIIFQREVARVQAVDGVDLTLAAGETLAIVGESGCGKTTLARGLVRLRDIDAGSIEFMGEDITRKRGGGLSSFRRQVTMIFQDPIASLDPRMRIGQSMQEPLDIHSIGSAGDRKRRVQEVMERVGLNPEHYNRFPHEFSGGQRQRIGIARALVLEPRVIVCDEPVSALDVSVQAQIVNLLEDLQRDLGLSYIVIAHDLDVVRRLADRVQVMYLGRVVEEGLGDQIYTQPRHPYTHALLSARPVADPVLARSRQRVVLRGDVPSPSNPPSGCHFHPRCPVARPSCSGFDPPLEIAADGHGWACAYPLSS